MSVSNAEIHVLPDADSLANRAADWLLTQALAKEGQFAVALSGGATPRRLYQCLAERAAFPWERAHWFWGDERFVSHDDPRSNYRMVREAMLRQTPAPDTNIHPIPTDGVSEQDAAILYERTLKHFYGADVFDPARPLFDVVLLGLGSDGHTASLFPGSPALGERTRWVMSVEGTTSAPETRITLTFPALESCRNTAFLVAGHDKRDIFARWRTGDQTLPASQLRPSGALLVFADAQAFE